MLSLDSRKQIRRVGRRRRKRRSRKLWPVQCGQNLQFVELRKWMKKLIGFKSHLTPATFTGIGRGLMTTRKLLPNDVLVSIPQRLLITTETVLNSDIGHIIKSWEPRLTPQQCLAVFLIWEEQKLKASDWYNYIKVLPPSFTTPVYFSMTELSFLPSSVRTQAQEECDKVTTLYREMVEFCQCYWTSFFKLFTCEKFRWAWCVVNTRSVFYETDRNDYISDREPNNIALVPFLDLLNHSPTANIKAGFNQSTRCYEIVTFDYYKTYDQVFISYGCHGNHKLFLEYGFCVPDNPQDEFEFSYGDLYQACKEFKVAYLDRKLGILRQNKLVQSLSCSMEGLSWKLWTALKILAMDWHQLQIWTKIYTDEEVFDSAVPLAMCMAKHLLQQYMKENLSQHAYIDKMMLSTDNKNHVDLARNLLSIERQILSASLNNFA